MKKYTSKFLTIIGFVVLSTAFIACGKKSDDSSNVNTNNSGYQMINGICYYNGQNTNNPNLCTNQGNNGYQMINGICYLNGQNTNNPALCYNQGNNGCYVQNGQQVCNGTTGNARQCYGQFIDQFGRQGTCYGQNCAGFTLREVTTGMTVQCI